MDIKKRSLIDTLYKFGEYIEMPNRRRRYLYWFDSGLVLWHINPCRLFNAKSSLYVYFEYI